MKRVLFVILAFLATTTPVAAQSPLTAEDPRLAFVKEFISFAKRAGLKSPELFGKENILDGYEAVRSLVFEPGTEKKSPEEDARLKGVKDFAQGIAELARNPVFVTKPPDLTDLKLDETTEDGVVFIFKIPDTNDKLVKGFRFNIRLKSVGKKDGTLRYKVFSVQRSATYEVPASSRDLFFT